MDWKKILQAELADATILVWKMQQVLTEGSELTMELLDLTCQLQHRSNVISGHVARWHLMGLWEGPEETGAEETGCEGE